MRGRRICTACGGDRCVVSACRGRCTAPGCAGHVGTCPLCNGDGVELVEDVAELDVAAPRRITWEAAQ